MPGSPLSTTPRNPEPRNRASSSASVSSSFACGRRSEHRAPTRSGAGSRPRSIGARAAESESGSVSVSMPSQPVATRRSMRTTSGEGSVPSSSMRSDRYCWNARSASAWRPALARRGSEVHASCRGTGGARTWASSTATASADRRAEISSSAVVVDRARHASSVNRAISPSAHSSPANSSSAGPVQSPSARCQGPHPIAS